MNANLLDLVGKQAMLPSLHYIKSADHYLLTWGPDTPQIYIYGASNPSKTFHPYHWLSVFGSFLKHCVYLQSEGKTKVYEKYLGMLHTFCKDTPVTKIADERYYVDFSKFIR